MQLQSLLRRLPAVHRLLEEPGIREAIDGMGRDLMIQICQSSLDQLRRRITHEKLTEDAVDAAARALPGVILERAAAAIRAAYQPVVNATGVLLHTNLGRAPLGSSMPSSLASYLALEYDITRGERGQRLAPLSGRLARLFGAEAAVMVNNNAAALVLLLACHASGREVIVSRSQLIEIGGSFRLPAVMAASGCRLREVGCTNRTHLADYEAAIGDDTAAILLAHQSNFRIVGFTACPEPAAVAELAHRRGLPLFMDQGSGNIHDLRRWDLPREETVTELLAAGADVVCFSGDKLLGGPQAGILVGRREWVEPLGKHPLYRALRPDKTALVLMDRVLLAHLSGHLEQIPLYRMLETPLEVLKRRAARLRRRLRAAGVDARSVATRSALGGGTTPDRTLASWGLAVSGGQELADRLRENVPAVIGRIEEDQVILDLRTVAPEQDPVVEQALVACQEPA